MSKEDKNGLLEDKKAKDKKLKQEDKEKQKAKNKSSVEKIKESFIAAENTIQEQKDKIIRLTAEMQNLNRRNKEEREKLLKYEGEELFKQLLPVLDDLERAIAASSDEQEGLISGVKMIYDHLRQILSSHDVEEIEALDQEFDHNTMEAVVTEESPTHKANCVIEVFQKGYIYKEKLLRPAMVKVSK